MRGELFSLPMCYSAGVVVVISIRFLCLVARPLRPPPPFPTTTTRTDRNLNIEALGYAAAQATMNRRVFDKGSDLTRTRSS